MSRLRGGKQQRRSIADNFLIVYCSFAMRLALLSAPHYREAIRMGGNQDGLEGRGTVRVRNVAN
jgi:hypothetical protein